MSEVCPACGFSGKIDLGFDLDLAGRRVRVRNEWVALSGYEWDLLYALHEKPGTVFTRERIFCRLYGSDPDAWTNDNALNALVYKTRKKIAGSRFHIQTQHGVGFRLTISPLRKGPHAGPRTCSTPEPLPLVF